MKHHGKSPKGFALQTTLLQSVAEVYLIYLEIPQLRGGDDEDADLSVGAGEAQKCHRLGNFKVPLISSKPETIVGCLVVSFRSCCFVKINPNFRGDV